MELPSIIYEQSVRMWIEVGTTASPICVKINSDVRLYLKLLSLYYQELTISWFNSKRLLKTQVFSYIKSITFWNVGMCSKQFEPRFSPDSFLLSSWCRSQFGICNSQLPELDSLSVLSMQRVKRCRWSHPKESIDLSVMLSSESFNYCYVWYEEEGFDLYMELFFDKWKILSQISFLGEIRGLVLRGIHFTLRQVTYLIWLFQVAISLHCYPNVASLRTK